MDETGTMLENPAPALSPSVSPALTSHHPLPILYWLRSPSMKVKAFVANMLREFLSREPMRRVLNQAFEISLRTMKEWLEKYLSPDFRGDHDETKAIQHLNMHSAVYDGKDLLWLLERMIELRIADTALEEWSEETTFVADL